MMQNFTEFYSSTVRLLFGYQHWMLSKLEEEGKAVCRCSPWRVFQTHFTWRCPVSLARGSASQENSSVQCWLSPPLSTLCLLGSKKPSETKAILFQPPLYIPKYTCSAAASGRWGQWQISPMRSSIAWETWMSCAKRDLNHHHQSTATDWKGEYCFLHFTQSGMRYRNMLDVVFD